MIGRRAFARGNSLWARAFNQQLPRRMSSCSVFVPSFSALTEKPLQGFAEQYREVNSTGLASTDITGDTLDEGEEKSEALAEILNTISSLQNVSILRNWSQLIRLGQEDWLSVLK